MSLNYKMAMDVLQHCYKMVFISKIWTGLPEIIL